MTTKFNTDWDIDYYKTNYESDEHWALRRAFIETHKDKFPESELVCLAQVFTNIEFLGCRYPDATMKKVSMLSKEVAAEYRRKRESTLKRTFVGASDAAGAKVKGRNAATTTRNNTIPNSSLKTSFQLNTGALSSNNFQAKSATKQRLFDPQQQSQPNAFKRPLEWKNRLENVGFILFETLAGGKSQPSINILQMSAAKQGAVCKVEFENKVSGKQEGTECVVYINNTKYGSAIVTDNKKDAKTQACDWALENARQISYTIKQKEGVKSVSIECDNETKTEPMPSTSTPAATNNRISSDNKGFKMMKLLGWSGGALGTSGGGIEEPISVQVKVDRKGLGLLPSEESNSNLDRQYFMKYLSAYKSDESAIHELVFSKDFTKEERKILHEIASRIGLKSKSRNQENGERYLIIHKKINLVHLANDILNDGPYAEFYELIPPVNAPINTTDEMNRKKKKRTNL